MPALVRPDELFELIRKAGVIKPDALAEFRANNPELSDEPRAIAQKLIAAKLLTPFQAKLLLAGRYKGFRLGAYILLEQLGQGGMGAVYLAEHDTLHRKAAIKVLPPGGNKLTIERFLREARAVAALDHPNIVRTHDVSKEGEVHFLVMEYVEGQTLDRLVTSGGPLSAQRAVEYIAQACAGLQHAYERGFIHRDIKPANLILAKDGTLKILDMGLARSNNNADALTEMLDAGAVVGTADYISPEQAMNDAGIDIRADIYSLGATFFAIVTGRPPFNGPTASKLIQHQVKDAPTVTSLDKTFPPGLAKVISKMMAKKPNDRYATPADVIAALEPWMNASQKVATGLSQTEAGQTRDLSKRSTTRVNKPKPKKGLIYAVAGGVAAAVVLGIIITVVIALSGNDKKITKVEPTTSEVIPTQPDNVPKATEPKPTTPATTAPPPTTAKGFVPPPQARELYKLDLGTGDPFKAKVKTIVHPNNEKEKSTKAIGTQGTGSLPYGWSGRAYIIDAETETEVAIRDGKPALGLRTTYTPDTAKAAGSAMLFSPKFECDSGYARVKFEYQSLAREKACMVKFKADGRTAEHVGYLTTPSAPWATFEQVFDMKMAKSGIVEIHNAGALNQDLWIRNLTISEAKAADLPKK